ncbi:TRAP transporter substrate-binding protein DctP [Alcaligenes sp. SDU_A2]|uniref:TRAP transporter substrate-binding protein DctP n=1 Tax=Alcaligenes sp. SDU_A2 TaxID=3136634 RepID=UPI002CA850B8|nr:TRAP transporter substrate-binding protein DctP [Alcaligenes sp.]HRL27495.1 TRAP transporter substrate-binding protein DctP [Alcaligenes sp.]
MKQLSRRSVIKGLGMAGVAALGAGASLARAADTVTWRMQALWDGGTTPQKFEEYFVKRVADLTEGRFKIDLYSAGQLVPANQAFDAVRGGAFQMMKTFDGYEAGKIPGLAFTSTVPFGFPEADQYEAWFYELGGLELAREAYAPAGLFYIAPTVYGPEPIHSKVAIQSIADLKGKKGRFVGLAATVMDAMGVSVTPLPTSEVYSALDKGVIDLADRGDLTANLEAGLGEVAKYIITPGPHQPSTATSYVANKAAYDRLPEQFKVALATAARDTSAALRQHILVADGVALEAFKKQGVTISSLDPADVLQARKQAVEVWRKATKNNPNAVKMLDSQIAFLERLGLLS